MRVLRFILRSISSYQYYFIAMLLCMIGVAAYTNFQGYFIKLMIDAVAEHSYNTLIETAIWYGVLQFSIILVWTAYDYMVLKPIL